MLIIKNRAIVKFLTLNFANAITLYPFVFLRSEALMSNKTLINHEKIHIRQQLELLIIGFYIFYFLEFVIKYFKYRSRVRAYYNLSFEREAYSNEADPEYLVRRRFWSFVNYF
ncbi:MAG: hypothetical protein ACM3PT_06090 [Deltaproteobacteria bacterium]